MVVLRWYWGVTGMQQVVREYVSMGILRVINIVLAQADKNVL